MQHTVNPNPTQSLKEGFPHIDDASVLLCATLFLMPAFYQRAMNP
jgi:hypothetical protein